MRCVDELDLLLHPLGKLLRFLVQCIGYFQPFSPGAGALPGSGRVQPVQLAEKHELVDDPHLFVKAALLRQVADPRQSLAGEGFFKEAYSSAVWQGDAYDHADGRGFARPVGAKQAEDRPRFDPQA